MNCNNTMHLTLALGNEVKIDEDTDLFACIYSSKECVERMMLINCDTATLALGSIEMDNLYHSLLRALRDTLGDSRMEKLIEYIKSGTVR